MKTTPGGARRAASSGTGKLRRRSMTDLAVPLKGSKENATVMEVLDDDPAPTDAGFSERLSRRFATLAVGTGAIWFGVVLIAIGFVLIGVTWARVAGLLNVALQLPYFASAGLAGLGLILVGLTVVNIATKHREMLEQNRQLEELKELLSELRRAVEG
jgi:hypothetical protein